MIYATSFTSLIAFILAIVGATINTKTKRKRHKYLITQEEAMHKYRTCLILLGIALAVLIIGALLNKLAY